ncbi:MAG: ATP-binding cassette domain-containing protein [Spirochaetia bacterium]|nr:ATP-binding cassette domain-containing protein [Spirochaetia bacterium]
MSKIVVERIKKSYSGVPAVRNVDFSLAEGEFLTLLGPSGCGKSTTLRVIAGLEDADEGKTIIDGKTFLSHEHAEGWLEASVYSVLPAGSETIIKAQSQGVDFTVLVNGFSSLKMDEKVWINFSSDFMNYYDPESEKLLSFQ